LALFNQEKTYESDVPSKVRDIRSIRVVVGNYELPQELPKTTPAPPTSPVLPPWPGAPASDSGQRRASGSTFFSPFASLYDRYPFAKSASDPTKRTGQQEPSSLKKTAAERQQEPSSPKKITAERQQEEEKPTKVQPATPKEPPKAWTPLVAAIVVLCGSLGGNLYMGWITWETRARYHALVRRRKKADRHWREDAHDPDVDAEER
jgi:hypothetical protein